METEGTGTQKEAIEWESNRVKWNGRKRARKSARETAEGRKANWTEEINSELNNTRCSVCAGKTCYTAAKLVAATPASGVRPRCLFSTERFPACTRLTSAFVPERSRFWGSPSLRKELGFRSSADVWPLQRHSIEDLKIFSCFLLSKRCALCGKALHCCRTTAIGQSCNCRDWPLRLLVNLASSSEAPH